MGEIRFTLTPPSQRFGMGHFSRLLAFAEGVDSSLTISGALVAACGVKSQELDARDWVTVGDFEWEGEDSWWVFDLAARANLQELERSITSQSRFRVLIIDHVHEMFQEVDLHIMPSPFPAPAPTGARRHYFGWEFILSRFRGVPGDSAFERRQAETGVVLTGGSDSAEVGRYWHREIAQGFQPEFRVDVVRGRFSASEFGAIHDNVRVIDGASEYPQSFKEYSLGLVVHGVSTFDLLVSGVPVVIMPNPEANHYREATELSDLGVAVVEQHPREAVHAFLQLLRDKDRLLEMQERLDDILVRRSAFRWVGFLKSQ